MKYLVTGMEMKLLDENTTKHFGVPSEILMEQAALVFVQELLLQYPESKNILIACGGGNNGGDGVAIARLLNQKNKNATVLLCTEKEEGLLKQQLQTYQAYHYPLVRQIDDLQDESFDLILDGLFGTGLSRNIEGNYYTIIEQLNAMHAKKVAIDMPSGISAEDGHVLGIAFHADDTYTFSYEKLGQYLYPGADYCGRIHCLAIGSTEESILERKPRAMYLEDEDIRQLLPKRIPDGHKGTFGKLLVIAGSVDMAGAAYFAAKAAYRTGVGLVKICTPQENRMALQTLIPEAILHTYGKTIDKNVFLEDLKWADAVLIGPGIGQSEQAKQLLQWTRAGVIAPLVMDADALNLLSENTDDLINPHLDVVVTPHLGEMSRLCQMPVSYIESHFCEKACEFADTYNVVCHLKSARSITAVPYGNHYINTTGNSGMATAGSGDVLAGIIASLIAQGMPYDLASAVGARIHGQAGDVAAQKVGKYALMASDLLDGLTELAYLQ